MRAITVKQPWASAIAQGSKRVENRTRPHPWRSAVGDTIAIHAGQGWDRDALNHPGLMELWKWCATRDGLLYGSDLVRYMVPTFYPKGMLLATAQLTDVHTCAGECSPWAEPGQWHLVLTEITALPEPLPAKGALGLWTPDSDLLDALEAAA